MGLDNAELTLWEEEGEFHSPSAGKPSGFIFSFFS
jgi:hypothetical protein